MVNQHFWLHFCCACGISGYTTINTLHAQSELTQKLLSSFPSSADIQCRISCEPPKPTLLTSQLACSQHLEEQQQKGVAAEGADEDSDDQAGARKPFTRTMQKQERDALQKWTQCSKCEKWRKVCAA